MKISANYYSILPRKIIAGTKGSYGIEKLDVSFSDEWTGLSKKVVFYPPNTDPVSVVYDGEPIDIPAEVMNIRGRTRYAIIGYKDEKKLLTVSGEIDVLSTLDDVENPAEKPTPSEIAQVLTYMQTAVDTVTSLRNDAESGVFDGIDGRDGVDGKDGANGKDGVDGKNGTHWFIGNKISGINDSTVYIYGSVAEDFYLNSETYDLYVLRDSGVWRYLGNIRGIRVELTPKGRWQQGEQYSKFDAVYHMRCLWISNDSNVDEEPCDESPHWSLALECAVFNGEDDCLADLEGFAFLPDEIYVATGRTIEIYNSSVCSCAENYYFRWICDIGKAYGIKFSITGEEALIGSYPLTLEICNRFGEVVYTKNSTVRVVSSNLSSSYMIAPLGDVYTAGKAWLDEVVEISDSQIEFVGVRESESGIYHSGVAGWDSNTFVCENEAIDLESGEMVSNLFCQGVRFEWQYFHYSSEVNGVQLFFGERELLDGSAEVLADNLSEMIYSIREINDAPVFVVLPPLWGKQDGMARQDMSGGGLNFSGKTKNECDRKIISSVETIVREIESRELNNVYFVPLCSCFDSENNMELEEIDVNPRVPVKVSVQKGAVNPSQNGYKQMADVFFSAYCAVLNEN